MGCDFSTARQWIGSPKNGSELVATPVADLLADGLVTIETAGRFLAVSRSTVYVLLGRGDLPSVRIGKCRRIPKCALVEYASRQVIK